MNGQENRRFFVAVHIGAGVHLQRNDAAKKRVMAEACKAAGDALSAGRSAMDACTLATMVLEDSPLTNAGHGSALTEDGHVECDASIMDGQGLFGAVGACPGLRNPIEVARQLALESQHAMPLHRVRPIFLAGDGAREWALKRDLDCAPSYREALRWNITAAQKASWEKYTTMIRSATSPRISFPLRPHSESAEQARIKSSPSTALNANKRQKTASESDTAGLKRKAANSLDEAPDFKSEPPDQIQDSGMDCRRTKDQATAVLDTNKRHLRDNSQSLDNSGRLPLHDSCNTNGGVSERDTNGRMLRSSVACSDDHSHQQDLNQLRHISCAAENLSGKEAEEKHYDTVGCICLDASGRCAASVSSGGITMKSSGRVGEAAIYGAGCWAQDSDKAETKSGLGAGEKPASACSVTGVGENIMRAGIAKAVCRDHGLQSSSLDDHCKAILSQGVAKKILPVADTPRDCGFIVLNARGCIRSRLEVEFVAAFSSASMGFAFMHSGLTKPVCKIERSHHNTQTTTASCLSGHPFLSGCRATLQ